MIRSLVLPGLVLAVVVGLTAGFMALAPNDARPTAQAPLTLPIKVMHHDVFGEHDGNEPLPMHGGDSPRYVKEVTFDVSGTPGDLWVWGHQMGFQYFGDNFFWDDGAGDYTATTGLNATYSAPYDGRSKGAIRINGGSWIDIDNDNVTCAATEEAQSCIGGVSSATRFRVNGTASDLQSGSNTIEFAFLGHDMLSSGYRVLDFAVLPSGYSGSLSHRDVRPADLITTTKVEEDPSQWTAPSGASVSNGASAWYARNSLKDWPGGDDIIASCNDCHGEAGRDLAYFAYDNESIEVRAGFHGLSEQEGKDIAAYIRSYNLTLEDGTSYDAPGRPWNPPYQPAPRGFGPNDEHPDVADVQYWAAGAGLEWVADHDEETLPYIAPDGTGNWDAGPFEQAGGFDLHRSIMDYDGQTFNMRDKPLSIQLPDWNRWLPIVHTLDIHGLAHYNQSDMKAEYENARNTAPDNLSTNDLRRFFGAVMDEFKNNGDWVVPANTSWLTVRGGKKFRGSKVERGAMQWGSTKLWEIHSEFHLSDKPNMGGGEGVREVRSWWPRHRPVFNIASHIAGDTQTNDGPYPQGPWLSHVWYHAWASMTGEGVPRAAQNTVDWNYQRMFSRAHDGTGLGSLGRWIATITKQNQLTLKNIPDNTNKFPLGDQGFNARRNGLYEAYRAFSNQKDRGYSDPSVVDDAAQAHLSSWLRFVYEFDISEFPRGDHRNDWDTPTTIPRIGYQNGADNAAARSIYTTLIKYPEEFDINASTYDSLATWGQAMFAEVPEWVGPPWDNWILEEGAGQVSLTISGDENPSPAPANFTLTAEIAGKDFDPTLVEIYIDDMLFAELEEAPFEVAWEGVQEGTYTVVAQAYAADGTSLTSLPLTVEVTESLDEPDDNPPATPVGPIGLMSEDVGPVGVAGSAAFEEDQYTVSGSGSDIWDQQDAYHFVHQEVSGDGAIIAQLTSQDNTDPWAKAGVMIRASLASDAAHAMVVGTPANGARLQHRAEAGGGSLDTILDGSAEAPIWLRLEREGNLLTGMISYDGQTWEAEGSVTLDLPETVVVGLAVTSHDDTALSTATFEGVSLTWLEEPPVEQAIALDAGWNLVARHVEPADPDMETLWEALGDTLVLVKNAAGANYFPEFGINEIGAWASDEAYMVYMTAPAALTIAGELLPLEQRTVELAEGWTYAPYRGTAPLDAEEAFAGLGSLLLAVDQDGGVYFPEEGLNTIGALQPGRGYRVYMMAAEAWALPAAADEPEGAPLMAGQQAQRRFSPSASILLLDAPSLPTGRQVDVLTVDSMGVGTGTIEQGRAAIVLAAQEEFVASGDGAQPGEPLMLRMGEERLTVAQVQDVLSGGIYEALTFAPSTVLHVHLATGVQEMVLHQSYPNPARRAVTVPLEVPAEGPVRLLLYDALGRQVRTLLDEPLTPGRHEVHVDVSGLASGVYHYQLRAGDARASGRMTVVR